MDKSPSSLTKLCAHCGMVKPLSAFLVMAGGNATYGQICATCRKDAIEKKSAPKETEDSMRSGTGVKIDAKAKVHNEIDKRQQHENSEEEYHAERDKDEALETDLTEKKETLVKQEKQHRENYMERRSFLNTTRKTDTTHATQMSIAERVAQATQNAEHQGKQEIAAKAEQKEKDIDLSGVFEDTRIAGKIKHSGIAAREGIAAKEGIGMKKFMGWAKDTVIGKTLEQAKPSVDEQTKGLSSTNPAEDYAERTWGPGKKK